MNIFRDINEFFSYLSTVDVIFLVAVIALLILIVTLIYFIRINKDNNKGDDLLLISNNEEKKDNVKESITNDIDNNNSDDIVNEEFEDTADEYNDEEGELLDLEALTKKLENEKPEEKIKLTEYEKDQEEKAIISYDELLKKHNKYAINYEKEEKFDDLVVKKVDLNDLENKEIEESLESVRVISYQKEEEFLKALKELNSLLN